MELPIPERQNLGANRNSSKKKSAVKSSHKLSKQEQHAVNGQCKSLAWVVGITKQLLLTSSHFVTPLYFTIQNYTICQRW